MREIQHRLWNDLSCCVGSCCSEAEKMKRNCKLDVFTCATTSRWPIAKLRLTPATYQTRLTVCCIHWCITCWIARRHAAALCESVGFCCAACCAPARQCECIGDGGVNVCVYACMCTLVVRLPFAAIYVCECVFAVCSRAHEDAERIACYSLIYPSIRHSHQPRIVYMTQSTAVAMPQSFVYIHRYIYTNGIAHVYACSLSCVQNRISKNTNRVFPALPHCYCLLEQRKQKKKLSI